MQIQAITNIPSDNNTIRDNHSSMGSGDDTIQHTYICNQGQTKKTYCLTITQLDKPLISIGQTITQLDKPLSSIGSDNNTTGQTP